MTPSARPLNIVSSISLQNFRGFRDSGSVKLAPLTFLVGPNSSGKSTVANALMLTAQSFNARAPTKFSGDWIGRLVDLGSFQDTVYRHKIKNSIVIQMGMRLSHPPGYLSGKSAISKYEIIWKWDIRDNSSKKSVDNFLSSRVNSLTIIDVTSGAEIEVATTQSYISIKFNGADYRVKINPGSFISDYWEVDRAIKSVLQTKPFPLGASLAGYKRLLEAYNSPWPQRFLGGFERVTSARSGPKRWVAKDNLSSEVGISSLLNDPYSMDLDSENSKSKRSFNREPVSKYLKELGIASTLERVNLSAYHTALQVTDSVTNVKANLADVGFGASQVIPVIKGCLSRSFGPLVIEQPEIHLHPKAQSQVADLICESSKFRQLFVETHSEHMINRARIKILEGKLNPQDVIILYVDKTNVGSKITSIGITADGDFTQSWPKGFFDERYNDSMTLLSLKSKDKVTINLDDKKK